MIVQISERALANLAETSLVMALADGGRGSRRGRSWLDWVSRSSDRC